MDKLLLQFSNPERLVTAKKGQYFYRKNDACYLLTLYGNRIEQIPLGLLKRGFVDSDSKYKVLSWVRTLKESQIFFSTDQELWVKTGEEKNKIGWNFLGNYDPFAYGRVGNYTPTPTPTATPTPTPTLPTGLCGLNINSVGGDAGYDVTYDVSSDFVSGGTINVLFNAQTIKDQLILFANDSMIVDTGCISGSYSQSTSISAGTTTIRVQVIPNCEGTTGTAWTLSITCV